MSTENDLALAYHMGYDDALAKRKPDASKAQVLAPYDIAIENDKLRDALRVLMVGRPKVKKVRGMTYDHAGGEVYFLACSGCGEWIDGDLDCIGEFDGPNFCPNCGGEFDGPMLCKKCGRLADLEYGDLCAECYDGDAE